MNAARMLLIRSREIEKEKMKTIPITPMKAFLRKGKGFFYNRRAWFTNTR